MTVRRVTTDPGHWTDHIAGAAPGDRITGITVHVDLVDGIAEADFTGDARVLGAYRVTPGRDADRIADQILAALLGRAVGQ